MLPDFLIVGAMKAGTTTLAYYLDQHPGVFLPEAELHFFNRDSNYERGIQWYEDQFQQAVEGQLVGEKTPTYSYLPICAPRIAKDLPKARLIWIFRNPVDRAYSNYWHAVTAGIEVLSFERALATESERLKKSPWYGYRKRSVYVEQVKRYLDYFPRARMCFTFFEELIDQQEAELGIVLDFLSLEEFPSPPQPRRKNASVLPRSIYFQWLARTILGAGRAFKTVRKVNRRRTIGYPAMDRQIRQQLEEFFAPHNSGLFNVIGRSTDKW